MASFRFQTHVTPGEGIYIPPNPEFDGLDVVVKIEPLAPKPEVEIVSPDKNGFHITESVLIPGLMVTNWIKDGYSSDDARDDEPKHGSPLDEICGGWADDKRSAEEIIRDIYGSRSPPRDRGPLS